MYTIGDFLIRIQNAYMAGKKNISYPYSNVVVAIGKILEKEGYVKSSKIKSQKVRNIEKKTLELELKYENKLPAVSSIRLVSKPSVHHYVGKQKLGRAATRHGIEIISTSHGVMTTKQAQKEGVGGELICQIY